MPLNVSGNNVSEVQLSLSQALFVGSSTGTLGLCVGGAVGILRSAHPGLAAVYTGAQFFVLGSTGSFVRDRALVYYGPNRSRRDELIASTIAGTVAGAAAGRFWSRLSLVSGGILFGTIAFLGQRSVQRSLDAPQTERSTGTVLQRLANSRWSPIKPLSNQDYEQNLSQRLLRLEAEIGLVDDKLQELRASKVSKVFDEG